MRRLGEERVRRPMSTGKKVVLVLVLGVLALVGVFGALALTHERINYAEARETVSGIASTKESIEKLFDAKLESLNLSDKDKAVMEEFETALAKCKDYKTSLEASNVLKDEEVAKKYDEVKEKYVRIEKLSQSWNDTKLLFDLTDENLATLKKSSNQTLKTLAEELSEYRAEVANFKKQYETNAKKDSAVIEAYGKMQLIGDELNKKYENMSLETIIGMSRDDILGFYDYYFGKKWKRFNSDKKCELVYAKIQGKDELAAKDMFRDGHKFGVTENEVWCIEEVPLKYICDRIYNK